MNYFGHCVAACWHRRDPGFVLGAMLPDLASMCGCRLAAPPARDPAIAAGIDWHHASDRAFHALPEIAQLMAELARRLAARGVGRGTARGAGHVAVELLLDGWLLDDPDAVEAYPLAIDRAGPRDLGAEILWLGPATGAFSGLGRPESCEDARFASIIVDPAPPAPRKFETLRGHLAAAGLPVAYRDPRAVASRVVRALSRRPALAARPGELPALVAEISELAPVVGERAGAIMGKLRQVIVGSASSDAAAGGRSPAAR